MTQIDIKTEITKHGHNQRSHNGVAVMSRNFWSGVIFGPGRTKITHFLVRLYKKLSDHVSFSGAMSDDLAGLAATYMRYQGGCSDNLKRSIGRKAEHMI